MMKKFIQWALTGTILLTAMQTAQALDIKSWTTSKGVKVLFVETHALPVIDATLTFKAGSSRDGDLHGISSLVNGLLVEGTGDLSAEQVAEGFESTGAELKHDSLRDMATIGLRSLSDRKLLDPVVDLFSRVVALPSFSQQAIERDRRAMLVALANGEKDVSTVTQKAFYAALYKGHPYAIGSGGTASALKKITRKDLLRFHQNYYVAKNANLSLVGDFTLAQAKQYAEKLTAKLKPGQPAKPIKTALAPSKGNTTHIKFDTTQTHILQGMPEMKRNDPDYYALYLGNHILGGSGFSSRLMKKIRVERGLVYSVYSYFIPMESNGPFQMGLGTRNAKAEEAGQLMDDVLRDFIKNGPSDAEIDHAKKNITGGFALKIDSNKKIAEYLSVIGFYNLPLDYLDTFNDRIMAVSADQIRDAFKRRVQPDSMIRVVVGPVS